MRAQARRRALAAQPMGMFGCRQILSFAKVCPKGLNPPGHRRAAAAPAWVAAALGGTWRLSLRCRQPCTGILAWVFDDHATEVLRARDRRSAVAVDSLNTRCTNRACSNQSRAGNVA
jgi:hypothetical protein